MSNFFSAAAAPAEITAIAGDLVVGFEIIKALVIAVVSFGIMVSALRFMRKH